MRRSPGRAIGRFPSSGSPDACASRWRTVAPGGPAGSSRSTTPSSAATRAATAVSSFVLDHKFGATDPCTLGVEEEYMLLDPTTFDLVQHVDAVLTAVSVDEFVERIGPELMQSVLEISTPVCHTAADVDT